MTRTERQQMVVDDLATLTDEIQPTAYDQLIDMDDGWYVRKMIHAVVIAARLEIQRRVINTAQAAAGRMDLVLD